MDMPNALLLFMASLLSTLQGTRAEQTPTPASAPEAPAAEVASSPAPTWPISFYFENRKESLAVSFFSVENALAISHEALDALSHHVRCFRTDRERPMHPRLVEIVARVTDAFGRENVDVVSGFRAPPYGAPHSRHFHGRAMDLRLPGVPSKKVAAWVWKNFRGVGVGYYPSQNFVHIDVRDVDIRWVDTSLHGESAHARYFSRPRNETVPDSAPRLAYDVPATLASPFTAGVMAAALSARLGIRGLD